jgi:radical SAM superfamily enzyme YgiQ (UPF0313 family)
VYPPITKFERYSSAIGSSGGQQIPLGVFYLASYLRSNGFEADVLDAEAGRLTHEDIIQRLQSGGFGVLGISTTTVAFHHALELAEEVRMALPETIIVVGGPHVSGLPTHAMEFDVFDFAVRNEGEETLVELMEAIAVNGNYEKIRGLIFRRNGEVVVNEKRPYIEDIDALPLPAYDLVSDFKYYTPPPCNYKKSPVANIITSRGCPNRCTFCDRSTFGQRTHARSARNIVSEIELLMTRYSIREITFVDDTFTINPKRVYDIFDIARSKGLRFPWTCMARINTVDEDLLRYMKENGCWHISFGIESSNEQILKEIHKNIKIDDVERVIGICHRLRILTKGFFIIGHPLETIETIDETINFAKGLKLSDVVVTLNTPLPGSYQFQHAKEYGVLDDGPWSKFNMWNPVFVPHGLTKEILLVKHKEFYRRFYLRPRILWRYFVSFLSLIGLKRMISVFSASRFLFDRKGREVG